MAEYDEMGREIPDTRPVAVPHNWDRPLSLHEEIKRFVRIELSRTAEMQGQESFEEADDFDVDEEPDPLSPYELQEGAPEWPGGVKDADGDPPLNPGEKPPQEAKKPVAGDSTEKAA